MTCMIAATDLSERGDRAVQRAFLLAGKAGANLIAVTVVDDSLPADVAAVMVPACEAQLTRLIAAIPSAGTVAHEIRVMRGDAALAVAALSAAERADLLILGLHRARPIADVFRETTMERIVRQVACPVLLVCTPAATPYHGVVAAVDFSPAAAAALRRAHAIAPDAPLVAVHALHVPYRGLMPADTVGAFLGEAEAAEAEWRRTQTLPAGLGKVELIEGSVEPVVSGVLSRTGADLIALGAHARSWLHAALVGSVVARMMREPPCDLLIARPD